MSRDQQPQQRRRGAPDVAQRANVDRLPPNAPQAEQGVLGCILLEPARSMGETLLKFRSTMAEPFYDLRHRTIYSVMCEMYDKRYMIDLVTLQQKLKDRQQLEAVGGLAYLSSLPDCVPSAANLTYYLDIVWDKYKGRKLIQTCTDILGKVYEHEEDIDKLIDHAETEILKVGADQFAGSMVSAKELVLAANAKLERAMSNDGQAGIPTGFDKLDKKISGMEPEDFIILAARPSVGKTSLAANILDHLAVQQKRPVGMFSVEMAPDMVMLRMICARAKVNWKMLQSGMACDQEIARISAASVVLSNAPIFIDGTPGLLTHEFRAKARRMVEMHGVEMIVVDYIQIMQSSKARNKRHEEVSDISGAIKAAAKELKIPIIGLSQLDRNLDKEKHKAPRLSDLRESGSLEQDGDKIMFLYETERKNSNARFDPNCLSVGCVIAKQRNGETGELPFNFYKQYTRYEEYYDGPTDEDDPSLFKAPPNPRNVARPQPDRPVQEEEPEPPQYTPD